MSILIPAEIEYFPGLAANLTPVELRVAIAQAEAIATGPSGSCANLEEREYKETIDISDAGLGHLRHCPITEVLKVELRGYAGPGDMGLDCWCEIPDTEWEICNEEIFFKCYSTFRGDGFRRGIGNRRGYGRRPMQHRQKVEARVTYCAGFDFQKTIPADWETTLPKGAERDCIADIVTMKSALAGIMLIRQTAADALAAAVPTGSASSSSTSTSTGGLQGELKRVTVDGQYTKEYFEKTDSSSSSNGTSSSSYAFIKDCSTSAAAGGSALEDLLSVFRRFKPKELPT